MGFHENSYYYVFGKRIHKAWIILVGCCFLSAGSLGVIFGCQGNFVVPVCNELGLTRAEISSWQQAYFLSSVVALPFAGKIMEKVSIRIVVGACASACALAAAAMGIYTELWQFQLSGVVYGVFGSCVFFLPTVTMLGNWFDKRAGFAMGMATAMASLAIVFLSPLFAQLVATIGWRNSYFVQGALVAVMTVPFALFVFKLRPADVNAYPYGYEGNKDAQADEGHRVVSGVSAKKALFSVTFIMLFLFAGIVSMVGAGFDSHIPGHAQAIGYDAMFGAFLVSALQLGSFLEKLIMGWVNDKIGVQRTVYVEFALVVAGMLGLAFFKSPALLIVSAFLFGVQDSFTSVSVPLLLRKYFGRKDYSQIYAWSRIGSSVFGSFAPVLVGLSYDLTGSYSPAFILASICCVVGCVFVIVARVTSKRVVWEDMPEGEVAFSLEDDRFRKITTES